MKLPRAMVLVYQPELKCSVWQDYFSRRRSLKTLTHELQRGTKEGKWVAWRLIWIVKEVMGSP